MGVRKDSPQFLADFVKKYAENKCRFTMTCDHMGIGPANASEWRHIHPEWDAELSRQERLLAETVEGGLIDEALKDGGQIVAKIFFLKNNWEQKYGERQVLEVQPGQLWFEQKPVIEGEIATKQLGGPNESTPDSVSDN